MVLSALLSPFIGWLLWASQSPALPATLRDPGIFTAGRLSEVFSDREEDADARLARSIDELARFAHKDTREAGARGGHDPYGIRVVTQEVGTPGGLDPDYLWHLANRESALNPLARARTSSAAGLYQFTANTWLCALRQYGADLGLASAAKIRRRPNGSCWVDDPSERRRLLALRYNTRVSTQVVTVFTRGNYHLLAQVLDRPPNMRELYTLHFFGETDGLAFLAAREATPGRFAYTVSGEAAGANRNLFYDGRRPRTVDELFRMFTFRA